MKEHSRMGIASFVISVVAWVLVVLPFVVTSDAFIIKYFLVSLWSALALVMLLALAIG